jgi:hypothetical protein
LGGFIYSSNNYGISFLQSFFTSTPWQKISCSASGQYVAAVASRTTQTNYVWISTNYATPFNLNPNLSTDMWTITKME